MTPELEAMLRSHKMDILAVLHAGAAVVTSPVTRPGPAPPKALPTMEAEPVEMDGRSPSEGTNERSDSDRPIKLRRAPHPIRFAGMHWQDELAARLREMKR